MAAAAILKNQKSRYLRNGMTDLYEIWYADAWMDNIKTWTGLSVEESIRMTEDRDKWRKYVHSVANPRIEDG